MIVQEGEVSEVGKRILESDEVEEQKDRLGGRGSTGCDTDADVRVDVGGETSKDGKGSALSVLPAKARRDAFI